MAQNVRVCCDAQAPANPKDKRDHMPQILPNPHRGVGLNPAALVPSADAEAVARLLALCPAHGETPLRDMRKLASSLGIASLHLKDERARMGLGSFKALGAAYAIAREAADVVEDDTWDHALAGRVFVTASAGNHGMSVAAGARIFGARSIIYIAETVPEAFAERLRAQNAEVRRVGAKYEDSMAAAERDAAADGFTLLSDSSWPEYTHLPYHVMEGYTQMAAEAATAMPLPPTHIFLQAGVGGLAAGVAAYARKVWRDEPEIVIVEPDAAPALIESIRAGHLVTTEGPVSEMGRLDCKTPSMIALEGLARDADHFVTISEAQAADAVTRIAEHDIHTTPSGVAGLAALLQGVVCLTSDARVLVFISEGPEDG